MNFDDVTAIQIPEGNVKSIAIGGVTVWEAPVVDKYTWDAVLASIDAGTYATDYAIGDTIPLNFGSTIPYKVGANGVINMQIAAFDADDLADGSGKAPITWISVECLNGLPMNSKQAEMDEDGTYKDGTGAIGGWEKSELRAYLKDTIKPLIPETVRNAIKEVTKSQMAYNASGSSYTQATTEDVWIPDESEIIDGIYSGLFPDTNSLVKVDVFNYSAVWWLRSTSGSNQFYYVNGNYGSVASSGMASYCDKQNDFAIGFCT